MAGTFIIIIICIAAAWIVLRARLTPVHEVTVRDIPQIVNRLQRHGKDGNYAVLMFVPPDSKDDVAVNLQYSIEGGVIGLDWVLTGPRNVADQEKVREFASGLGQSLVEEEKNKVRYLRVTGRGIVELGERIVLDFYRVKPETKLELIAEGFTWPPR